MKSIRLMFATVAFLGASASFAAEGDQVLHDCKVVEVDRVMLIRFNDVRLEEYNPEVDHYQGDALVKVIKTEDKAIHLKIGEKNFKNAVRRQTESDAHSVFAAEAKSGKGYVVVVDEMSDEGSAQLFGIFDYDSAAPISFDGDKEWIADLICK